ncbi:type II secretion system protein GspD [Sporomusa aerivorans]|uniref:type II secretion system protein GspD n=1 Tax=Sporomusa aerivorans TaxID=204936 RepID=UPI00352AEC03
MSCLFKAMILAAGLVFFSTTGVAAAKPQVNMQVINGEVRDVLTALATIGKVNILLDDTVNGTITIQLEDVAYESAVDLVCKMKGLTYHQVDNVLIVGIADQIGRGFGSVHIFKLRFINPDSVKDTILSILFGEKKGQRETTVEGSSGIRSINSQKNSAKNSVTTTQEVTSREKSTELDRLTIDYATNSLILFGTVAEAEKIQGLLNELDIPYQQVSLEAEVLAISKEKNRDLGIEWSWDTAPQYAERTIDEEGNVTVARAKNSGIIQFGRNPEGYPYEFYYQAKINALVSNGDAKVLAKPKVTTIDGKRAQILIGDRIPVLVDKIQDGATTTTIEYVDAGIKLTFLPRINSADFITVDVRTEVSSATLVSDMKAYKITTREAETTVRLKNGQTMVIGGLIGTTDNETKKAVPFFSELPMIGALFKNFSKSRNDTEVVIFLTPRIVK